MFYFAGGNRLATLASSTDISNQNFRATTILSVRKGVEGVMAADGQVTLENTIMKQKAKKLRFMYNDQVLVGFAGATADAFALFEKLEGKLEKYNGNLPRASVELAKDWRTDNGDVIEPDEEVAAIGSGGPYALAAARALLAHSDLDAKGIALESMKIAASICLYTNEEFEIKFLSNPTENQR
jgi:ATP-dependent HslUV protease subunit HslV